MMYQNNITNKNEKLMDEYKNLEVKNDQLKMKIEHL